MAVSLSPIGGAASQFFNANGVPLSGGKIYTYEAGTTTPKATYTEANGLTAHTNPIILDSTGHVPGGEIWLTSEQAYLFVLKASNDTLIGTWDNIYGYAAGTADAVTEVQVATADQTDFVLTSMIYTPGTNTLQVYIDGVNQVVGNAYTEVSATTVTFVSGIHAGAVVKFVQINSAATSADLVTYTPAGTGAVPTTVQAKLRESVSVLDFGTTGTADDTLVIQAALDSGNSIVVAPPGTYIFTRLTIPSGVTFIGYGATLKLKDNSNNMANHYAITHAGANPINISVLGFAFDGNKVNQQNSGSNNFSVYWTNGLVFTSGNNITVADLTFHDWTAEGLSFRGCTNSTVDNIVAYSNATVGVRIGALADPVTINCIISNIHSYDNASVGNTGYDGMFIEHCQACAFSNLNTHYQVAPLFEGGTGIKLVTVLDCTFNGVICNSNQWQGLHLADSRRNVFTGLVCSNNGLVDYPGGGAGILLVLLSTDNVFIGATLSSNLIRGVLVYDDDCVDNSFIGCKLLDNTIGLETRAPRTKLVSSESTSTTHVSFVKQAAIDPGYATITDNTFIGGAVAFSFSTTTQLLIKATSRIGNNIVTAAAGFDTFITIGSSGAPTFENSWTNAGGSYATCAFYKDVNGIVTIIGTVNNGVNTPTAIFTLPVGFRPAARLDYPAYYSGAAQIAVDTNGAVYCISKVIGTLAIPSITFLAA